MHLLTQALGALGLYCYMWHTMEVSYASHARRTKKPACMTCRKAKRKCGINPTCERCALSPLLDVHQLYHLICTSVTSLEVFLCNSSIRRAASGLNWAKTRDRGHSLQVAIDMKRGWVLSTRYFFSRQGVPCIRMKTHGARASERTADRSYIMVRQGTHTCFTRHTRRRGCQVAWAWIKGIESLAFRPSATGLQASWYLTLGSCTQTIRQSNGTLSLTSRSSPAKPIRR